MTRFGYLWTVLLLVVFTPQIGGSEEQGPTRAEVEKMMGLHSEGDRVRGQMDTVGFVVEEAAADDVVSTAIDLEHESLAAQDRRLGMASDEGFIGGICPHDDHLYASRVYVHLTERITAPRVLLIGVFHKARLWDLRDRVVFLVGYWALITLVPVPGLGAPNIDDPGGHGSHVASIAVSSLLSADGRYNGVAPGSPGLCPGVRRVRSGQLCRRHPCRGLGNNEQEQKQAQDQSSQPVVQRRGALPLLA